MKKTTRFYSILLVLFIYISCKSQPPAPVIIPEIEITPVSIPEIILPPVILPLTAFEQMLLQIKQNGQDIKKIFILCENGLIIVKADIQSEAGDFEVIYDLEQAKALERSVYEVGFTIRDKETDTFWEDTLIWRPRPGNAGVLLSFDDDYIKTWEEYLDFFDKFEARVTFFLQGEFVPFSKTALDRGHDVGYHSLNHLDLRRTSRTVFLRETIEAAESFRQEGVPLSSFAFPYGFSEPWMHEILLRSFGVLRGYGVTFRIYNKYEIKQSFISSRAIDNTVIRGDENYERIITSMLRTVKFLDGDWILPLTTHDISQASWAITRRRLEFLLETIGDLGLIFYRFSDISGLPEEISK